MIDNVLSRLDKVRGNGRSQWTARCPAHQDRGPSLSIKHAADGKILLHCFAGCRVEEVAGAIGLELTELFPDDDRPERLDAWKHRQLTQEREQLRLRVMITDAAKARQETISEADEATCKAARRRIQEIEEALR